MRALNVEPVVALGSFVLLIGSMSWWAMSAPELDDPGRPRWKGAEIDHLVATVPQIGAFEDFYVNNQNPFVPYNLRGPEDRRLDPKPPIRPPPKPPPPTYKPPRPPVVVIEQPREPLVLPKLSPAQPDAPIVFGFVGGDNGQALLVRMPGAETSIKMVPGQKDSGWTLVAIDNNNLATFVDPHGVEHRYLIGEGDLAVAPEGGIEMLVPGSLKNPDKKPVSGTKQPGVPQQLDPRAPRPLPLPERKRPEKRPDKPKLPRPTDKK